MSILFFIWTSSALALTIPQDEHHLITNSALEIRQEVAVSGPNSTSSRKPAKFNTTYTWPNASIPRWKATYDPKKLYKDLNLCNYLDCEVPGGDNDESDDEDDSNGNSTALSVLSNSTKRSWRRSLFKRGNSRPFGEGSSNEMTSNPYPDAYELVDDDPSVYTEGADYGTLDHSNEIHTTQNMVVEHRLEEQTLYTWAQSVFTTKDTADASQAALKATLHDEGKALVKKMFPWGKSFLSKNKNPTLEKLLFEIVGGKHNRDFAVIPKAPNGAKAKAWKGQKPISDARTKEMTSNVKSGTWPNEVLYNAGRVLPETTHYMQDEAEHIQKTTADLSWALDGAGTHLTHVPFLDFNGDPWAPGENFEGYVRDTIKGASSQLGETAEKFYGKTIETYDSMIQDTRAVGDHLATEQDPDFYPTEADYKAQAKKWEKEEKRLSKASDKANEEMLDAYQRYLDAKAEADKAEQKFLKPGLKLSQRDAERKQAKWGTLKDKADRLSDEYEHTYLVRFNTAKSALEMHSQQGTEQRIGELEHAKSDMEAVHNEFEGLSLDENEFVPDDHTNCKRDGSCNIDRTKSKQGGEEKKPLTEQKPGEEQKPGIAEPENRVDPETAKPAGEGQDPVLPETHEPALGLPKGPPTKAGGV